MRIEIISSSLFQDVVESTKGEVVKQLLTLKNSSSTAKPIQLNSLTDTDYLDSEVLNFIKGELGFSFSNKTYEGGLSLLSVLKNTVRRQVFVKIKQMLTTHFTTTPSLTKHGILSVVFESGVAITFDVFWSDTNETSGFMVFSNVVKIKDLNSLPEVLYNKSMVNSLEKLINLQNNSGFEDTDLAQIGELHTFMTLKPANACIGVLPSGSVIEATKNNTLGSLLAKELFDEWMRALRLQNVRRINEYHLDRRSTSYKKYIRTAQSKVIMPSAQIALVELNSPFLNFNAKLRIDIVNDLAYVTLQ